jgi:dienelactone hydrolase
MTVVGAALAALAGAACTSRPLVRHEAQAPASTTTASTVPAAALTTTSSSTPATTSTVPATTAATRPALVALTVHLVDTSRPTVSHGQTISSSRALTTLVWYPSHPGRWPLVVFAHGYQVGPSPYLALLHTWAADGYVVAAPEFPLTDADVAGPNLDENDITNQPADVRFVIASLTAASSPVAGHVDGGRLAVAGHSDGGETALAVASDPSSRLKAAIVLSAQPVSDGTTANPPLLVGQGDHDTVNPPADGEAVFKAASAPKFFLDLLGAGHLPPFSGAAPWAAVVDRVTLDFLDRYLAGRTSSSGALLSDGRAGVATISAS